MYSNIELSVITLAFAPWDGILLFELFHSKRSHLVGASKRYATNITLLLGKIAYVILVLIAKPTKWDLLLWNDSFSEWETGVTSSQ